MSRLQATGLSAGYTETPIINHLDLSIPDKKVTAIIGSNGCGKSTLLKTLTRILPHSAGSILLDGEHIAKRNTKALAKDMAILPQSPETTGGLTAGELVSYGRFPHQRGFGRLTAKDRMIIGRAMEQTGTLDYNCRPLDALSGGQRQRVWIAMALAQETDMIFLDEPTTYLDLAHQLEVLELLQHLNETEERTIVMVLHDLNHASRFADHIVAMKNGCIVKTGTPDEVIEHVVLKEVFHIDAMIGRDPRTQKPMCMTYHLLKGENTNEKHTTHNRPVTGHA